MNFHRLIKLWLNGPPPEKPEPELVPSGPDFSEVRGQRLAKRAIEVAVAGGHNLLMIGPPGAGKSMLAKRVPTIMPPVQYTDGTTEPAPFVAPHHTASYAALIGGGSSIPRPGMISRANGGVLFLDEMPEFNRGALEALREPLEADTVTISRTGGTSTYRAKFMLIAAMNPCPCGYYPNCSCDPKAVKKYRARISGPLLDRIDIHVQIPSTTLTALRGPLAEASNTMRNRVYGAQWRQWNRQKQLNARLEIGAFTEADLQLLQDCAPRVMSARAYVRILRVARTIADLSASEAISKDHFLEAIDYRLIEE